jgi:hypothetical protein
MSISSTENPFVFMMALFMQAIIFLKGFVVKIFNDPEKPID